MKQSLTQLKSKIERHIPKKKSGAEQHDKALTKFFESCFEAFIQIDFDKIKCVVIASPGFVKDEFWKYVEKQLVNPDIAALNKRTLFMQKVVKTKSSTGFLNSLTEVLSDPTVANLLKDTKAFKEIKALDDFYMVSWS